MTLTFAQMPGDLQVIGIQGRERLNAPFCFDVDLVSREGQLDCTAWLDRDASLSFALGQSPANSVHGQIHSARRLVRGAELSLYRVRLMPPLQRLASQQRRHTYNGLSVVQIIEHLVGRHAFRFEHLTGQYPPREHCQQFDESDLHLLQRLCEEEGISYRFEQREHDCVVVFCDDPAGFPEWPVATQVEHLAEQFSSRTCYASHLGEGYAPPLAMDARQHEADNQPLWLPCAASSTPGHRHQLSVRMLERLRCERREIMGRSTHPWFRCGHVIRVEGHPDALFNDQWLLTEVWHRARRLAPLRGSDAQNVIRILHAMATDDLAKTFGAGPHDIGHGLEQSRLESYSNRFQVIPWTMPYRPPLEHSKPLVSGPLPATLIDSRADTTGRVRIRYDWQTSAADSAADSWARLVSGIDTLQAGARLQVAFFEGDPDQPVVCAVHRDDHPPLTHLHHVLHLDGVAQQAQASIVQLRDGERLHIDSPVAMSLTSALATLNMTRNGIDGRPHGPFVRVSDNEPAIQDLQLMHPQHDQRPLAHCTWYIVRMPTPDMAQLARIPARDILFEGQSDAQGWLGLKPQALARLHGFTRQPGDPLWLVHPGHCRPLQGFFRRR